MIYSHLSAFEVLPLLEAFLSGHQFGFFLEATHTEALVFFFYREKVEAVRQVCRQNAVDAAASQLQVQADAR